MNKSCVSFKRFDRLARPCVQDMNRIAAARDKSLPVRRIRHISDIIWQTRKCFDRLARLGVQYLYLLSVAHEEGNRLSVRGVCRIIEKIVNFCFEPVGKCAGLDVQYLYLSIELNCEPFAVWRKCGVLDEGIMPVKRTDKSAKLDVPNANLLGVKTACNEVSVRRKRDRRNPPFLAERLKRRTISNVPQPQFEIAPAGKMLPVRRKRSGKTANAAAIR